MEPRYDNQNRLLCAAKRTNGEPCNGPAIKGYDKCRKHAGKKVSTIQQEQATRRALAELELNQDANPLDELLTEVQRCAAAVRWLSDQVNKLQDREITHGVTKTVQHADGSRDVTASAAVNVWVKLWQDERDRLARVCKLALDAGVDERRVRLAESQGRLIVDVIRATLGDLGIIESEEVTTVVTRHLRAITA